MENQYTNFSFRIIDQPFYCKSDILYPKTVEVSYTVQSEKHQILYGYISKEEWMNQLLKTGSLHYENCFIENFNLKAFQKNDENSIPQKLKLGKLTFINCYIFNEQNIILSDIIFEDEVCFDSCVFHGKELLLRNTRFYGKSVNFHQSSFIISHLDFTNSIIESELVSFKNCKFTASSKDFQYSNFKNTVVQFINTSFNKGKLSFINSHFDNCNISFKVSSFNEGKKDFQYARFNHCDISFEKVDFNNGILDFRKLELDECKLNFNRSNIGIGEVTFEGTEFKKGRFLYKKVNHKEGNLNISMLHFSTTEAIFDGSIFSGGLIDCSASTFKYLSFRGCHFNHYVDLRVQQAEYIDLSNTIIRDIVDFTPYEHPVEIVYLNLTGIKLLGSLYICWNENFVEKIIESQNSNDFQQLANQYLILKQNYHNIGRYNDEDKAYVKYRRFEAKAKLANIKNTNKIKLLIYYPAYLFKWFVFDLIGLYATSPARVLTSVIITWFVFGMLYFILQYEQLGATISAVNNPDHLSNLSQSFYHSAITFFTIGYGDVYPQGLSRLFSAMEGFIGVFMMSYFTVAFVRKILR